MTQETSARENFHAAIANLFDQATRDPAFKNGSPLHKAAIAAQIALGKVEQRLDALRSTENASDKRIISDELQKAETELNNAAIEFLRNSMDGNAGTAAAALELLQGLPAGLSKKHDLNSVKAGLDQVILKHKKADWPKVK